MRNSVTKSELEILNVLWEAGTPLSRGKILEQSKDKNWKDNSIHILLNGMLKKGLIREDGFVRSGKVWGRLFAPIITAEEYYADVFCSGPKLDPAVFLGLILERSKPGKESIEAMQELLKRAEE